MAKKRLSMRKLKDVLRLKFECGLSNRKIASSCNVARSTVADYLERVQRCGISWPLPEGVSDTELERFLFPADPSSRSLKPPLPDFLYLHSELKRKGVTLFLLWQEYKERYSEGYQYSWFSNLYREWRGKLDVSMRQVHKAGEKTFVDYAGQTMEIVDRLTGEIREAQIFVAVLGASNYTYAEATWTQSLPDWIGSHVRMFEYFEGCSEILIPDNLRSGISKTCRYEPDINPTYAAMASHYGVAVIPARVKKPKDKAKAEIGVQVTERWILARLRNRQFFSLSELNAAIRELLEELNNRPFQKIPGTRRSLFETIDKPALKPLPSTPFEYAEWKKAKVNIDYHIEVERHYYSVPHSHVKDKVDVRFTSSIVEIFHKGKRIASHVRSFKKGTHTTVREHMPKAHQKCSEWTPSRIIAWGEKTGTNVGNIFRKIMANRPHPEQGYRSCLGIIHLEKGYGSERLEAACKRALRIGSPSYKSVKSILKTGLDKQQLLIDEETDPVKHQHIRGSDYYQ